MLRRQISGRRVSFVGPGCFVCRWAAARPRVVRAASFARRVVSKTGQAPSPPTGTAPRSPPVPSGPSGALHTSGAWPLIGASSRSPARPCRRPPAPQPGPAVLFVLAAVVLRWRAYVCAREKVRPASLCHRESAKKLALRAQNNSNSAFLRSLGEFFRGNAAGGGVPGEFFRESAVE